MMNVIYFIAFCYVFVIFACLESKGMGFRLFFYSIGKFIWGMSSANRPIICKKLQFQVTNIVLSIWIQDSRLRKNYFNPTSLDSRFKIQGSENKLKSNLFRFKIQGLERNIQPNLFGFKIQGSGKKLLQSILFGFKKKSSIQPFWIQGSRLRKKKKIFNPTSLDSRFKIQGWRPSDSRSFCWHLESWILNPTPWNQEVYFGILNLESSILPPWIQKVCLVSWILNLQSWIRST